MVRAKVASPRNRTNGSATSANTVKVLPNPPPAWDANPSATPVAETTPRKRLTRVRDADQTDASIDASKAYSARSASVSAAWPDVSGVPPSRAAAVGSGGGEAVVSALIA